MCEIPQAHRLIVAASCPQYAAFAANSPNVKLSVSSHSSKTLQRTTEKQEAIELGTVGGNSSWSRSTVDNYLRIEQRLSS